VGTDLQRVGRAPAILIVVAAVVLAFLGLTALGCGKDAHPAPTHAAAPRASSPAAPTRNHTDTCDLGGGVTVTVSGGATCPSASAKTETTAPAREPPATARAKSSSAGLNRLVGARIMTAMKGTSPSPSLLARARKGQIGGVILFGANISASLPAAISALQSAAHAGGHPSLVIATDQEGGEIRRLPTSPPSQAPGQMSPSSTQRQGLATARALRARGINTDLAPVADVLAPGGFLGSRSFGSSPARVAASACEFARGLQQGGVFPTFKHFPGLGRATADTDTGVVHVNAPTPALLSDVGAYRSCQPALVMLSNAIYPALDRDAPAVLSSKIIRGLLRGQLGFRGVTISDTLSAPAVASSSTAVRAAKAGVDILLYTDEAVSARAYRELLGAARDGQISRGALRASAERIHALGSR
jgi:beta-N-acetylhexosaminidase